MNKFYLIVPIVLLALFGGIHWQHGKHADQKATAHAAALAHARQIEDAKKAEAEAAARADAEKRAAERLADEKKKEAEKLAKWEAEGARLADETAGHVASLAARTEESTTLDRQLADLRAATDTSRRESFELASQVELARIAKRNAEFEVQRLTEAVARKAAHTSLVDSAP